MSVKIIIGLLLAGAVGSGALFLHVSNSTDQSNLATSTVYGYGSASTTLTTSTTVITTTSTVTNTPPPIVKIPAPTPTPNPSPSVSISSITPNQGSVGTTIQITGKGFTSVSQVMIGTSAAISNVSVNSTGTILTFTMPSSAGAYCVAGRPCPMYALLIQPGTYNISVRNSDYISSNAVTFTLKGSENT